MNYLEFLETNGWNIRHTDERPVRKGQTFSYRDLGLSSASLKMLQKYPDGIYAHQKATIQSFLDGKNVVMTTSTASGKSLAFQACATELLSRDPQARIAAIYPLKALATEQFHRWEALLEDTGLNVKAGRIDGDIDVGKRIGILRKSRVVVFTPDIIHAWLLSNTQEKAVQDFLRNLSLVVLDEAHTYSGVFGSNAAFLIRRVLHINSKLGGHTRFIASSATMAGPADHMKNLTGQEFAVVGPELDTSAQRALTIKLVEPPDGLNHLEALARLITFFASKPDHQSITFVDSRKQTEYIAAIARRDSSVDEEPELDLLNALQDHQVLPYRSGYEPNDREEIQQRLASGTLRGVVSTSALEMGIDLPNLSVGILFGLPRSATSYFQRIGRVGRRREGIILVVNDGSVNTEAIFREPDRLKKLPLVQSTLYLRNPRIQYIHAMCLARSGGEDESICDSLDVETEQFESPLDLPEDFYGICKAERIGEIGEELHSLKSQAGDDPNHAFPIRDLDVQFKVECIVRKERVSLGTLSFDQMMREAYPGAVYYYQTCAYRVTKVKISARTIETRHERRYFTTPSCPPKGIYPNLASQVLGHLRFGQLSVVECGIQVRESVIGFRERRGQDETVIQYPLAPATGCYFDSPRFVRYSFTTGVSLTHPSLMQEHVRSDAIAKLLYEAFLMVLPFEPQDISGGSDKFRKSLGPICNGDRFVCIYDQTNGSLRLTSRMMEPEILRRVLSCATEIATNDPSIEIGEETRVALESMKTDAELAAVNPDFQTEPSTGDRYQRVIRPGSIGININNDNAEFSVQNVFFSRSLNDLVYKGVHELNRARAQQTTQYYGPATEIIPTSSLRPVEGESQVGFYDFETGEIVDIPETEGEF